MSKLSEILKNNLVMMLERQEMSGSDLARSLKISPQSVSKYFRPDVDLRTETIESLAEALNCEPWELLVDNSGESKPVSIRAQLEKLENEHLRAIGRLTLERDRLQDAVSAIPLELRDAFEKAEPELRQWALDAALDVLRSGDQDQDVDHGLLEEPAPTSLRPVGSKHKRREKS